MRATKRNVLVGLVLLITIPMLFMWAFHRRTVTRYERQLRAAGEKLEIEQLLPLPVLPENNGATVFRRLLPGWQWGGTNVLSRNPPIAMRFVAPGKAAVGWEQPDLRSDTTNTWDELEGALDRCRDELDLVYETAARPGLDFELDYRLGPTLPLPHLAPLKGAVQRLSAVALCDLHHADAVGAGTNLQAMLALVRGLGAERLGISQLVRYAMAHISAATTWELLQSPQVTEEQLAALQRDWARIDFLSPTEEALAMERALSQLTLERMRNSHTQFRQYFELGGSATPALTSGPIGDGLLEEVGVGSKEVCWRLFWSYPDQMRTLKGTQVLLESLRQVRASHAFQPALSRQQERLKALGLVIPQDDSRYWGVAGKSDLRSLFSESVVSLSHITRRLYQTEAARELTVAALALRRYQLAQGRYPGELAALVPKYISVLPCDPADGQPLRYRLQPDGSFVLYSLGEDGRDDGGDGSASTPSQSSNSSQWQNGRDLVWPWRATAAEVEAFQQKQERKRRR